MTIARPAKLAVTLAGALAALLLPTAVPAQAQSACSTATAAPADTLADAPAEGGADPEQARLRDARTAAFTERAGLGDFVHRFPAALCATRGAAEAERLVDAWGEALWRAAVNRAQGRRTGGDLPARDDRPLYWARLAMTVRLAQWRPDFTVDAGRLRQRFEDASRGLRDNDFSGAPDVRRVFVSGFDPFGLDTELRRANPSGSAVLQLNGRRITLADGTRAEIRAVVLPVRYGDFDRGIVERAFGPRLAPGPRAGDQITTISQGYPGLFTLEAWAGRARSADPYPDNVGALSGGTRDHPVTAPGLGPGAEFIATSLPAEEMTTVQQPFPVRLNSAVTEIPAGGDRPVDREDGPTPGSRAVAGGGGGYLSNEVAYRSNRLRLELAPDLPGGHLHTPVLTGLPALPDQLTGPDLERNEAAITDEVLDILRHATP
ncbi:pyroglutamyl peptidase [Streptomyces sp. CB01881]|uniref:pyroglutamyl peptidase n=1 Tax=Streptomyces sp. CB01881 TaxID=2078691 RepID=UPI000CDC97F9|nr:pyroglutamyl peptidase [Streptomyces sp. CB01881]AUY53807.1 pyroglutamyl peptidase [Streptomyces sp. CB01881]TYC68814.1 pyroglutamyl peptidase [Streptomyces sp. CB01881]